MIIVRATVISIVTLGQFRRTKKCWSTITG
jgi:hypothetical protein